MNRSSSGADRRQVAERLVVGGAGFSLHADLLVNNNKHWLRRAAAVWPCGKKVILLTLAAERSPITAVHPPAPLPELALRLTRS